MTIKQQGGIFGRNPAFNDVTVQGDVEVDGQLGVKTSSHWDASTGITAAGRIHTSDGTATGGFNYGNGTVINMGSMSSHPVQMIVGNSTKAIFETDGDLKIVSGNLVINTSGQGIDFSATSGTGTSELFDDYEEGTWTPVLTGSGSNPTGTVVAKYTKVGQVVSVEGKYTFSTAGSGNYALTFASLPFTVAAGRITGTFSLLDAGTAWYQGVCSGDSVNVAFTTVAPVTFSSTTPFTVAASDELNFNFTYVTS